MSRYRKKGGRGGGAEANVAKQKGKGKKKRENHNVLLSYQKIIIFLNKKLACGLGSCAWVTFIVSCSLLYLFIYNTIIKAIHLLLKG